MAKQNIRPEQTVNKGDAIFRLTHVFLEVGRGPVIHFWSRYCARTTKRVFALKQQLVEQV